MNDTFAVYLAHHGETACTLTGQHTGLNDLPITEGGESNTRRLGGRLNGITFATVFTDYVVKSNRRASLASMRLRHDR